MRTRPFQQYVLAIFTLLHNLYIIDRRLFSLAVNNDLDVP